MTQNWQNVDRIAVHKSTVLTGVSIGNKNNGPTDNRQGT